MSRSRVCGPLSCSPLSLDRGDPVSFGAPKGVTPAVAGTAGACSDDHTGHAQLVDRAARALQYCRWPEASLRGRRSRLRAIELQLLLTELPRCHLPRRSVGQTRDESNGFSFLLLLLWLFVLFCFVSVLKLWEMSMVHLGDNPGLPWRGSRGALHTQIGSSLK